MKWEPLHETRHHHETTAPNYIYDARILPLVIYGQIRINDHLLHSFAHRLILPAILADTRMRIFLPRSRIAHQESDHRPSLDSLQTAITTLSLHDPCF